MFEVAHFIPARQRGLTIDDAPGVLVARLPSWHHRQHDARDQNGANRHQHHGRRLTSQRERQHCPRVANIQAWQPAHGWWIDIPRRPGHMTHVAQRGGVWRVEAVIHRRCQTQRHEDAADALCSEGGVGEQVVEGIGQSLRLHEETIGHRSGSHDLAVAWRHEMVGVGIDRPGSRTQAADEARAHRGERRVGRLLEMQVSCEPRECANQQCRSQRLLPPAQPGNDRCGEWSGQQVAHQTSKRIGPSAVHRRRR